MSLTRQHLLRASWAGAVAAAKQLNKLLAKAAVLLASHVNHSVHQWLKKAIATRKAILQPLHQQLRMIQATTGTCTAQLITTMVTTTTGTTRRATTTAAVTTTTVTTATSAKATMATATHLVTNRRAKECGYAALDVSKAFQE